MIKTRKSAVNAKKICIWKTINVTFVQISIKNALNVRDIRINVQNALERLVGFDKKYQWDEQCLANLLTKYEVVV